MKSNLISAIAGWKSAALLALVAMVAAVAFSGVLTNSQSATAQTTPKPLYSVTIVVGGSGTVTVPDSGDGVAITAATLTGAGAGITITAGAEDSATDDADAADDTVTINVAETVYPGSYTLTFDAGVPDDTDTEDIREDRVAVTVVGKSANPGDTVEVTFPAGLGTPADRFVIGSDSTASGLFRDAPTRARPTIQCADDTTGTGSPTTCDRNVDTGITLRVKIANDSPLGKIYVSPAATTGATEHIINVVAAQVATGMTLTPPVLGISSNAGGDGSTITIKVTDNRGQPVDGQTVNLSTTRGQFVNCGTPAVTLPVCKVTTDAEGSQTVTLRGDNRAGSATVTATAGTLTRTLPVTFFGTAANLTATAASGVATVDQGKSSFVFLTVTDKDGNAVQGSTPGSSVTTEIENPTVVTLDNSVEYEGTPSPADNVPACSVGTNVAGKCAVQISASATASRGIHTVTASMRVGTKTLSDTIDIRVVGAPASLETDAPDSVEPRTTVTINISVYDSDGELVGGGNVKVVKLEGRGAVLGTDDSDNAALTGGKASFRYYATSTDAAAVFELTAGAGPAAVTEIIEIMVAAPVAEPDMDDDMEDATWNKELVSGQNLVVWNGEDGADPSAGATDGVQSIWSYNAGAGTWDGYFVDAADVPGGNTLTSLTNGDAYWVIVE